MKIINWLVLVLLLSTTVSNGESFSMTSDGSVVNKANVSIVCDLSYTVNSSDENDDDEYLLSAVPNVVALGNEDSIAVASAFHPSQIWAIVRIRGSPVASVSA